MACLPEEIARGYCLIASAAFLKAPARKSLCPGSLRSSSSALSSSSWGRATHLGAFHAKYS